MSRAPRLADYARAAALSLRRETSDTLYAFAPVRMVLLAGSAPAGLAAFPRCPRRGDAARGAAMLDGRFGFCGTVLETGPEGDPWGMRAPSRAFAAMLHGFSWLAHLTASKDDAAAAAARTLVDGWISAYGVWNGFSWAPDILAPRVMAWICAGETLFAAGDPGTPSRLASLGRQSRRLRRALGLASDGAPRLKAAAALSLAGLALPGADKLKAAGFAALERELARQILPDGGHVSRSPQAAAEILIDLALLNDAAQRAGEALPDRVRRVVDRLAPMVRFFRMNDGALASFHGGGEGERAAIDAALALDDAQGKPFGFAPHSGYHRAEAGGTIVVLDAGAPPAGPEAHASSLAFELSAPGGRIVVNCGWAPDQPPGWRDAVRATAAHATLTLEETSSARLLPPDWRRRLLGARFMAAPKAAQARRNEEEMGMWLEGGHDGYRAAYGLTHRRRLFLAADGGDVRGEDALSRPVEDGPPEDVESRRRFAIRFHLHPGVKASLSRDSMSALLVLGNGDGWRFRTDGGPVRLERSVYLAAGGAPRRSVQVVIQGEAESYGAGDRPPNRVRWAFQRLGRVGAAAGGGAA